MIGTMEQPQSADPGVIEVPEQHCLECGHKFNRIGDLDDEADKPIPHVSPILCIRCGAVHYLDDDMRVRPLTAEERKELAHDHETMAELQKQQRRVHFVNAQAN